jgi:hypothetical protein
MQLTSGAGRITTHDALHELGPNYSVLAGGNNTDHIITPQKSGYSDYRASFEYAAEGIRAYLANPNYFKTVAPLFAARVQDRVNSHPILNRIVQYNNLLAAISPAAGAAAIAGSEKADAFDPAAESEIEPK